VAGSFGNVRYCRLESLRNLVSTGPRSRERGISDASRLASRIPFLLQWGRARASAELVLLLPPGRQVRNKFLATACLAGEHNTAIGSGSWLLVSLIVDVVLCEQERGAKYHPAARGFNCQRTSACLCTARRRESFKPHSKERRV